MAEQLLIWPLRTGSVPKDLVGRTFAPAEAFAYEALGEYARLQSSAVLPRLLRAGVLHLYLGMGRWAYCTVAADGSLSDLEGDHVDSGLVVGKQSGGTVPAQFLSLADKTSLERLHLAFFPRKLSDAKMAEIAGVLEELGAITGAAPGNAASNAETLRQEYLKSLDNEAQAVHRQLANELRVEDKRYRSQLEKLELAKRTAAESYHKQIQQLDFDERRALNGLTSPMSTTMPASRTSQLAEYYKAVQQQSATPTVSPAELTAKAFRDERVRLGAVLRSQDQSYQQSKALLVAENKKLVEAFKKNANVQLAALARAQQDVLQAEKDNLAEEHAARRQLLSSKAAAFVMIDLTKLRTEPTVWQPCMRRAVQTSGLMFETASGSSAGGELVFPAQSVLSRALAQKLEEAERSGQSGPNLLQGGVVICLPDAIGVLEELAHYRVASYTSLAEWTKKKGLGGKLTNGELVDIYHQVQGLRSLVLDSLASLTLIQSWDALQNAAKNAPSQLVFEMTGMDLGVLGGIRHTPLALWSDIERRMPKLAAFGEEIGRQTALAHERAEIRARDQVLMQRSEAFLRTMDLLDMHVDADKIYFGSCVGALIGGLDDTAAGFYYLESQLRDLVSASDGNLLERMLCFNDTAALKELKLGVSQLRESDNFMATVADGIGVLRKRQEIMEVADELYEQLEKGSKDSLMLGVVARDATLTRYLFKVGLRRKPGRIEAMLVAMLAWPAAKVVRWEFGDLSQKLGGGAAAFERWKERGFVQKCIESGRFGSNNAPSPTFYRTRVYGSAMLLDTLYLLHLFSKEDVDDRTRYEIYGRASSFGASTMKIWANLIESAEFPDDIGKVAPRGFIGSRLFFSGMAGAFGILSAYWGLNQADALSDRILAGIGLGVEILKAFGELKLLGDFLAGSTATRVLAALIGLGSSTLILYASWGLAVIAVAPDVARFGKYLLGRTNTTVAFFAVKSDAIKRWASLSSFGSAGFVNYEQELTGLAECMESVQ